MLNWETYSPQHFYHHHHHPVIDRSEYANKMNCHLTRSKRTDLEMNPHRSFSLELESKLRVDYSCYPQPQHVRVWNTIDDPTSWCDAYLCMRNGWSTWCCCGIIKSNALTYRSYKSCSATTRIDPDLSWTLFWVVFPREETRCPRRTKLPEAFV